MIKQIEKLNSIWVEIDHFSIHARVSNKKDHVQDIVLVHGIGASSRYFLPLGEYLAPLYNIYIPDLPGFGKSKKPKHALNLCELARALYNFTQAVGIKHPILLGNSLGCQIIAHSIIQYPSWALNAIQIGPTINSTKRTAWQQLKAWFKNFKEKPFSQLARLKDHIVNGISRILRTLRYTLEDGIKKKSPNIKASASVIPDNEQKNISSEWTEKISKLLPGGNLIILPNKGQVITDNSPQSLAQIIHNFLASQFATAN